MMKHAQNNTSLITIENLDLVSSNLTIVILAHFSTYHSLISHLISASSFFYIEMPISEVPNSIGHINFFAGTSLGWRYARTACFTSRFQMEIS